MNIQHDPLRWYALAYKRASLTPWFLKPSGDQDWLYRWGCPECGTSKPTAQLGHSTLFLRWDGKDGTVPAELSAVNLSGPDHDVLCDDTFQDDWYGSILVAHASSVRGLAALRRIAAKSPAGTASLVEHVETSTEINLEKHLELKSTTGVNPNFDWEDRHRSDLSLVNHFSPLQVGCRGGAMPRVL